MLSVSRTPMSERNIWNSRRINWSVAALSLTHIPVEVSVSNRVVRTVKTVEWENVDMAEKTNDATQQVLDMRQRLDRCKTRVTTARTKKAGAEDVLVAADDAIEQLGLDPDRDLERQEARLVATIQEDLEKLEEHLDEADSVLDGS